MLQQIDIESLLFIDIETVSQKPTYEELAPNIQDFWNHKGSIIAPEFSPEEAYQNKAAIFAEFGKIICISIGYVIKMDGQLEAKLKSFYHDDEGTLLKEFQAFVHKIEKGKRVYSLCGHNIKEFDIPYLCRRILINKIDLPNFLDFTSKKPWEVSVYDTLHLWRFGDYKNYTSLNLLCAVFNVPTPKDDIDGSMVGKVYWQENDLQKIVKYCQKDVVAVMQLILSLQNKSLIKEENIHITT